MQVAPRQQPWQRSTKEAQAALALAIIDGIAPGPTHRCISHM